MKIVVIGSNSFSGASFVKSALVKGADVIGMSRSPEPHKAFLPYMWDGIESKNFTFYEYDLNHNLDMIMEVINKERPQYIVNYAAQSMVAQSWENPDHWFMTNVVSSVRLHDQLRQCDFIDKYIHVTTPEVYGSTDGFIKESTNFNPSTPYAVSRAAADMSLLSFFDAYNFPVVFTRAANVYGPGQQLYRIIPRTVLFIRLGKKLNLHGGGVSKRAFIHIDDVSSATWQIMLKGKLGDTYHISTNEIITIRALVELICKKMAVDFDEYVTIGKERLGKDAAYMLDSSKCRSELGWKDEIGIEAGIDMCIEWVDKYIDELSGESHDYVHKP